MVQESYRDMKRTGKLYLSPQLLQLEKLALAAPLPPDSRGGSSGRIPAHYASSAASSASLPRTPLSSCRTPTFRAATGGKAKACHLYVASS